MAITKATASSVAPAAKGDLVVGSATNDAAVLAVGTNNHVLTADSSTATGLKWAAAGGGGKVLQVVAATTSGQNTTTSTSTYADSGITATITPTSASSKVLVIIAAGGIGFGSSTSSTIGGYKAQIVRDSTSLLENHQASVLEWSSVADKTLFTQQSFVYLDSPATTSSTTYKLQIKAIYSNQTIYAQSSGGGGNTSTITLLEIGA